MVNNPIPSNLPLPLAEIEILAPGDGARLVSPIEIATNLITGPEGRLRIELINEDGEILARKVLIWNLLNAVKQRVHTTLDFEISGVAESARLVVSVDDDYGRLRAISSVDILLLAEGPYEESPALDYLENLVILNPSAESVVESGSILIQGIARTHSDRPLNVQLIARDGRILASGDAYVAHPAGYDYGVFSITLSAQVTSRQWIQVAVRETGDRIPGDLHYSTLEFVLTP